MSRSLFLSHAHADLHLKNEFLRAAAPLDFWPGEFWDDRQIPLGHLWDQVIRQALHNADRGVLLLSPAFLASHYIAETELPILCEKGALAIALKPLRFDGTMNLRGLTRQHVFHDHRGRAFCELRSRPERRRFVAEAFEC